MQIKTKFDKGDKVWVLSEEKNNPNCSKCGALNMKVSGWRLDLGSCIVEAVRARTVESWERTEKRKIIITYKLNYLGDSDEKDTFGSKKKAQAELAKRNGEAKQ